MAQSTIQGIRIAGMVSAVPVPTRSAEDEAGVFGPQMAAKVSESIGIRVRHVAGPNVCASDLCTTAAEQLLQRLNWNREEIRALILVTQTPDYILPATSHVLHQRLGLPVSCCAFDVNLGCSGFVYGLWMASNTARALGGKVLLLVGDTISRLASKQDQSVAFLFGDAGSAAGLEPSPEASPMYFEMGADGSGVPSLIVPAGGTREPATPASSVRTEREGGNIRSDQDLYMDGAEVFTFTLRRVPGLVKDVLQLAGCEVADIDAFVFHQANRFMLDHLAKKLKVPPEAFVLGLENYGNTSSASIPMAIGATALRSRLQKQPTRLLLAGFGVGFSWAGAVVTCGPGVFPEIVEHAA